MIFKNYKVLIDKELNPCRDKSHRGHLSSEGRFAEAKNRNIKMQKASEIQPISEVFSYPPPAFRRKILKQRGGRNLQ